MYRTIIAGCNGRERGRGAVSLAHAISSATGARLAAGRRAPSPSAPVPRQLRRPARGARARPASLRDELAPEALIRVEADLSPAHALRRVAGAENADLLVVGSRHRRGLQRIVEGDQAMQVLHGAPCAVAVAPDLLAPRIELHRIGVGIDATPESALALLHGARARASHRRAPVAARGGRRDRSPDGSGLSVTPSYVDALQELTEERRAATQELLARRLQACEGVTADGARGRGRPGRASCRGHRGPRPARPRLAPLGPGAPPRARQHVGARHPPCRVPRPRPATPGRCRARGSAARALAVSRAMSGAPPDPKTTTLDFGRILVGVDRRQGGRDALALAALLRDGWAGARRGLCLCVRPHGEPRRGGGGRGGAAR